MPDITRIPAARVQNVVEMNIIVRVITSVMACHLGIIQLVGVQQRALGKSHVVEINIIAFLGYVITCHLGIIQPAGVQQRALGKRHVPAERIVFLVWHTVAVRCLVVQNPPVESTVQRPSQRPAQHASTRHQNHRYQQTVHQ